MIKVGDNSGKEIEFDSFTFKGGEEHVRFNLLKGNSFSIVADLRTSEEVMQLLMIVDAIRNAKPSPLISLHITYFPYARQDRICNYGEAFGAKVMAKLINSLNLYRVTVDDPHSDVSIALLNNAEAVTQSSLIYRTDIVDKVIAAGDDALIVAPDAGAAKKSQTISKVLQVPMVQAGKVRDLVTGNLTGFEVFANEEALKGKHLFIFDDICDGGGTFLGLGDVLDNYSPASKHLWFTNGIFSSPKQEEALHEMYDSVTALHNWKA